MIKEHKVKITRKDLYLKNYSKINYSSISGQERKMKYVNKDIVDIFVKMVEDLN